MTFTLYSVWLEDPAVATSEDQIAAQMQTAGLLEQGGIVSDKISVDNIDARVTGQWRLGSAVSRMFATELESLGESQYGAIPLYDVQGKDIKRGYYNVQSANTNPAHQSTESVYEYTLTLSFVGTRGDYWRAVRTNEEAISTGLTSGGTDYIWVSGQATKTRWYDAANGTESATVQETVTGDYGTYDKYDPGEPSFSSPTLIYEVPFEVESNIDVAVYDDRLRDRKHSFVSSTGHQYDTEQYDTHTSAGFAEARQWPHIFDVQHEYDGRPVVDTHRLRVVFDEKQGEIRAYQHDGYGWSRVSIDHSDYELFDADIVGIDPAEVRVFSEWEKTDGSIDSALLKFGRGMSEVVVRVPENESSIDGDLESLLSPIASGQANDPQPNGHLVRREDTK